MTRTDVAIVGGGPGGAIAALFLARAGIDTTIVERDPFPRFHIGESFTGWAGKLLRDAGLGDEMDRIGHPIKHGVNVWGPEGKNSFYVPVVDQRPDGSRERSTTWQVRRSDFDSMMLDQALAAGGKLMTSEARRPLVDATGRVHGVELATSTGSEDLEAEVVIDASGQGCFMARSGLTSEKRRGDYSAQIAIFTHLEGANRGNSDEPDNTVILYQKPNHWAWFIPVDAETVSVGVVVPSSYYREQKESPVEFLEREFRELNPELAWRTAEATMAIEPQIISNYSYSVDQYVGPGWLCVGDSHQFVDPVFSFGVHLALYEGRRAAQEVIELLASGERSPDEFKEYQRWSAAGQGIIKDLVDAFWGNPFAFGYLVHVKHTDDMIDLFAGRVYDITEPSAGLMALRNIANTARARTAQAS